MTQNRPHALKQLTAGLHVLTPDGQQWVISSTSNLTMRALAHTPWAWLRRGNTYQQLKGKPALLALRIVEEKHA